MTCWRNWPWNTNVLRSDASPNDYRQRTSDYTECKRKWGKSKIRVVSQLPGLITWFHLEMGRWTNYLICSQRTLWSMPLTVQEDIIPQGKIIFTEFQRLEGWYSILCNMPAPEIIVRPDKYTFILANIRFIYFVCLHKRNILFMFNYVTGL